jgi:hypothetical protein
MACGIVHRALRAIVIVVGRLTGALVASWPPHGPRLPLQQRLIVVVVAIAAALACVPALGLISSFVAWGAGECQA